MTNFLIGILELTAGMSLLIVLALLCLRLFGKRFTAKCRYIIWALILIRLAFPIGGGILPALIEVPIESPAARVEVPENDVNTPTVLENGEFQVPSTSAENHTPQFTPPYFQGGQIEEQNPTSIPGYIESEGESRPADRVITTADVVAIIAVVYFAGAIIFLTWNLLAYFIYTRQVLKNARKASPEWQKNLVAICKNKKLKSVPEFYVSEGIHSPVAFGLFRRKIVLPSIEFSENGLIGTLAHEVTHCKRRDLWVKFIILFARAVNWFNPLVHIAASRCEMEMELSCDEDVLSGMNENIRRSYGNVMLEIARNCSRKRSPLTTHFNPRKNAVKKRIMNILDMTKKKRGRVIIAITLVLCIIAGTIIGCGVTNNDESKDNPDDKQIENTDTIAYDELSDFLTDEQIAVYETAHDLYGLFIADPAGVEGLHYEGSGFSESEGSYTIGNFNYVAARGKYQNYPEFREFCLTAFTEAYYDEINRTGTDSAAFIERDNRLYYRDTALGGEFGHDIDEYPDTYELISRSDTEIRFNVVGYYKNSGGGDRIYTLSKCAQPITMVLTENGWRFSLFADTAHVDMGLKEEKVADYYFGKKSIAELAELSVIYQGEEILLGDWFEKNEMNPYKYAILDLNGDYSREMVFDLAKGPNNENTDVGSLILHSQDDNVYAHLLYTREFNELRSDGTFSYSGNASNMGICRLDFNGDVCYQMYLALRMVPDGGMAQSSEELTYDIGGNSVSEEEFNAYLTEYNRKTTATWYYIYDVDLHSGAKATLYLNGNDPNWYAEVQTAQIDDTGVPNTVVLHRFANGTGIGIYHAYVLDGTNGNLIPVTPVDEVIEEYVEVSSNDDAWILKISGKNYTIDKAQFADYPADTICDIPRFDFIRQFAVVNDQLICKVGIFCAGDGTGFAEENLYIRYGYDNGKIIPVEISVQKGNEYVSQDNAPIQGAFADEDVLSSGNYHEFIADDSEYMVKLIFRANEVLKDVHFSSLEYDDNGTLGVAEKLYTLSELTPDKPLVTGVVFYGSMTTYGISFVDADNQKHYCAVYISGQDGALMVEEVQDYMSNDTNQPSTDTVVSTDIADYKNTVYSGTDLVYEGYTVKLALPHPIYDEEILDFHIHLPQINSDSSSAVQWNKEILEKYNQNYSDLLQRAASGTKANKFAYVTYETVTSGDVLTIYITDLAGVPNSGDWGFTYDIYHYDTAKDTFMTTDEFLAYYAKGQFADYTVSDIVKFMNDHVFATDEVGYPYPLTEEHIYGVIPSVFGNGQFDVVYKSYAIEGTVTTRELFAAYPTITTTSVKNNVTADFTYRMHYPEYRTCHDKEIYGQPSGYRLLISEKAEGHYSTGYYLDCLFTEDIANPPEGYIGDFYSPVGGYTDGRMYLTVDHETDRGHVKAMIPYDHPDTAQDYYRGIHYKYFDYDRILSGSNQKVNDSIAGLVAEVLDAYRNSEDPNLLLPASKTEYVAYPLDTIRENPDADEIGECLKNASITSSGIINFNIDLGDGYVMSLPIGIGGFGDSWQAYFTGVYIVHGTPLFEEG